MLVYAIKFDVERTEVAEPTETHPESNVPAIGPFSSNRFIIRVFAEKLPPESLVTIALATLDEDALVAEFATLPAVEIVANLKSSMLALEATSSLTMRLRTTVFATFVFKIPGLFVTNVRGKESDPITMLVAFVVPICKMVFAPVKVSIAAFVFGILNSAVFVKIAPGPK